MIEFDLNLLATLLGVFGTILGGVIAVSRLCRRFSRMEERIEQSGRLHRVLAEGLYACLDGLHQQGCNGEVTKALGNLHRHLFEELVQ